MIDDVWVMIEKKIGPPRFSQSAIFDHQSSIP